MFSLITNETFHQKICSYQTARCVNHDQKMFILSMIKTTSRGNLDLSQTKHVGANVISVLNAAMPFVSEGLDK